MEVKGNQFGNIQNADRISNYAPISSGPVFHGELKALDQLIGQLEKARNDGDIEPDLADTVLGETRSAASLVATHDGITPAVSRLRRVKQLLSAAAVAAPLVDSVTKVVELISAHGG